MRFLVSNISPGISPSGHFLGFQYIKLSCLETDGSMNKSACRFTLERRRFDGRALRIFVTFVFTSERK